MISLLYRLADRARNRVRVRCGSAEQASGCRGEDLAHRFLRRQGFKIVARNFRARSGRAEIDLIGWDQDKLVFLEVKSRATDEFGTPDRAVDAEKQSRIYLAAREYARRANVEWEHVRFDIVSVLLADSPKIELQRDAFSPGRTL